MKIIGVVKKDGLHKKQDSDFMMASGYKSLNMSNGIWELHICYDADSNIRIINDDNNTFISDDRLFVIADDTQQKLTDAALARMIDNKGINAIKYIQCNINLVLFNKRQNLLYLASNRATAGRMYYAVLNGNFYFSNDFKLLVKFKNSLLINKCALYGYCKFGAVPEDFTFDKEIKAVPVGHYANILFDEWHVNYFPFYQFDYNENNEIKNSDDILSTVENVLKMNAKALSNNHIHMLISGGIDSSLFAFYLKEYTNDIAGHYCSFGINDPEHKYAETVAKRLGIPLEVHTLYDESVIHEIEDTALNTTYPHNDFSNVSVNFLLKNIKGSCAIAPTVIECNGADDGFGYDALRKIPIWQKLYKIPSWLLSLFSEGATIGDTWMYDSAILRKLYYIYRAREKNIYISHMIAGAGTKLMKKDFHYDNELKEMITTFFNNNIAEESYDDYAKMNVAQFYHLNSRLWTAKGYTPAEDLNIAIEFPFTWLNILETQCKVPLNYKIFNNQVKWPLKELLAHYMDEDFIYRKKSGFAPPLQRWLNNNTVYDYCYQSVMDGLLIDMFQKDKIDKVFKLVRDKKNISRYVLNLLWALIFLEVWLKVNNINYVK